MHDAVSQIVPGTTFALLQRLLAAPAPNNSCLLPGAVGGVIRDMAAELGLDCAPIGSTGNLGIAIGDAAAPLDLLISAHMDRPCFRVLDLNAGSLYPLCAIRVPGDDYQCGGIALRFRDGRVQVAAGGRLRFQSKSGELRSTFQAERGELRWGDTVMMHSEPQLRDGLIIGTGLDNALGVLIALLAAQRLQEQGASGRVLFAFTDQEEAPPSGLFGQGAARLAGEMSPPRLGFINIDAHNARHDHQPGLGASHAFVSGDGRGSVLPMDWQAQAESLAAEMNARRPNTVRLNYGYVSRSDDMLLNLWTRCRGLVGVPLRNAHTTEETAALGDVAAAVEWLGAFVSRLLRTTE
ncbi:MAG: M20/M25/M40 family metallo-hydrolase [Chloroflexi bacterium]|nr:M20/M25/M40 family metallo-hydrolase [Chloroflexota bacterium]